MVELTRKEKLVYDKIVELVGIMKAPVFDDVVGTVVGNNYGIGTRNVEEYDNITRSLQRKGLIRRKKEGSRFTNYWEIAGMEKAVR